MSSNPNNSSFVNNNVNNNNFAGDNNITNNQNNNHINNINNNINNTNSHNDSDFMDTNGDHNSKHGLPESGSTCLRTGYDTDVLRLIGKHLISIGLKQTVDLLLQESGLNGLDHPVAEKFQQHVLSGEWDKALSLVKEISKYTDGDKDANCKEMSLLLSEQKFLELIEDNNHIKALRCLRLEITPITENTKRIQHLATFLMCRSIDEVRLKANWKGKGLESRQLLLTKFQRYIPSFIMLPAKRLETLLSQAVELQRARCSLHITKESETDDEIDLKHDHICTSDKFPLDSRQALDNHRTEIWFCAFSNDGSKLATGGIGGKVKIWDIDPIAGMLKERCSIDCSCYAITCLAWSPNDVYLLICVSEGKPELWIYNVDKEDNHNTVVLGEDESFATTCSWHLSGEIFAAANIKGFFNIFDLDGNRKGSREGVRVQCLAFPHTDPKVLLAADSLNRIKAYSIRDMTSRSVDTVGTDEVDILEERHPIISFIIDHEDKYIAVNLKDQGVHLWDFKTRTLLRMFAGVLQRHFTIYSSFSSPSPSFLASGSEDGKVYIYHLHRDQPVAILHGHSRCVNCVSWNPKYPEFLVSVSDDRDVRLWGPTQLENDNVMCISRDNSINSNLLVDCMTNGNSYDILGAKTTVK